MTTTDFAAARAFRVDGLGPALADLASRGLRPRRGPVPTGRGRYAVLRDPDDRAVVITEFD